MFSENSEKIFESLKFLEELNNELEKLILRKSQLDKEIWLELNKQKKSSIP